MAALQVLTSLQRKLLASTSITSVERLGEGIGQLQSLTSLELVLGARLTSALEMRNAAIAQTRELLNHNKLGGLSSRRIRTPSSEKSHRRASAPTSAVSEEEAEEGVVRRNSTEATFHRSAGATLMR